jgi:hypothetical protein
MKDITHNPCVYSGATPEPATLRISNVARFDPPPPDIIFHSGTPNELRITRECIIYRGQKVEDAGAVHHALLEIITGRRDLPAPVAARELDVEAERLPVLKINMAQAGVGERAHGYVNGWNDCVDEFARSAAQSTAPVSTDQAGDALLPEPSPLYFQALELVRDAERASVSMVQRRLRIGWDAARDLIELMLMRSEIPEEWAPQFASVVRAPSPNNSPAGRKSD